MKQEEIQLLLVDLSARLPYGVKVYVGDDLAMTLRQIDYKGFCESWENEDFKCHSRWMLPYLRPMSSMTEEEKRKFQSFFPGCFGDQWLDIEEGIIEIFECSSTMTLYLYDFERMIDWLNAHHFDYRGLIKKGLAIEAPEGMYSLKGE